MNLLCFPTSMLSFPDDYLDHNQQHQGIGAGNDNTFSGNSNRPLSFESWLLSETKSSFSINISKYSFVKPSFFSSKVTYYTIDTSINQTSTFSVQRRFSDFVKLRHILSLRFPGALVPPLLEKKPLFQSTASSSQGNNDMSNVFLEKRMHALNLFLLYISRNPYFRNDTAFVEFYSSQDKFSNCIDAIGKRNQKTELSVGQLRWNEAIGLCESPANAGIAVQSAIKELTLLHSKLKAFKAQLKILHAKYKQFSDSWRDLGKPLQAWKEAEKKNIGLISGIFNFDTNSDPESTQALPRSLNVGGILNDALDMQQQQAKCSKNGYVDLKIHVIGKVAFEIRVVEELLVALRKTRSAIIRHRRAMMNFRAQAVLKHMHAQSSSDSVSGTRLLTNGDTVPQQNTVTEGSTVTSTRHEESLADEEIVSSDEEMRRLLSIQKEAIMSIRGLLVLELGRYRRERTVRVSSIFNELGSIQYISADMSKQIWSEFTSLFPIDLPANSEYVLFYFAMNHNMITTTSSNSAQILSENHPRTEGMSFATTSFVEPNTLSMIQHSQTRDDMYTTGTMVRRLEPISEDSNIDTTTSAMKRRSSLKVVFDFNAEHQDEISAKAGQLLVGALDSHDPNWYVAKDEKGMEGIIPANYVEVVGDYESVIHDDGENMTPNKPKMNASPKKPKISQPSTPQQSNPIQQRPVNFLSEIRNFNKNALTEA